MSTNEKLIHPELSYKVTGLFFHVHNELGRYCREKQYAEALETLLKKKRYSYERERTVPVKGIEREDTNVADFVVESAIVIELKAKNTVTKDDYYQVQRYLLAT